MAGSIIFSETLTPGYAMLMSPNKDETANHGCHCPGNMAVRMRKVLAIPRSCAVRPLHSDGLFQYTTSKSGLVLPVLLFYKA